MKKLTKIKLINWHLFSNQTVDIRDNTLISGENGSGKSTLLDAIQYLLVGGRSGAKFNVAATDDARRTLEGYVRGRLGAENKEYIRDGDVVTHVALEFYDDETSEYTIVGVILDLPKHTNIKERFYIMENLSIHDEMFIDQSNYPRDYRSMKDYFKDHFKRDMVTFDTQRQYRDGLSRLFGMDAGKYSKILPKALAFKSIDLQEFFYDFLLDDDPIDIKSLKNNVSQLKKIESQIQKDRAKLEKLDDIVDNGQDYEQKSGQVNINEILNMINWIERREEVLKSAETEIARTDQRLETLREEKQKLDDKLAGNEGNIIDLEKSKMGSDLNRTISNYQTQLRRVEDEYNLQREIVLSVRESLTNEVATLKQLANTIDNKSIKDLVNYYQQHEENLDTKKLLELLGVVAVDLGDLRDEYSLARNTVEREKNELSERLRMAQQRLNQLKRNVKTYPRSVDDLVQALVSGLKKRYHQDVVVAPLCELIEVNDEKWRNALEGFLNTQRFDLIVDPEYFDAALQIYDEVKKDLNIFGVGLVNTNKIQGFGSITSGSLAEKITTDHTYARYYINMLLNGITCENDLHNLKNHARAITPSAMTYLNHTARQINPRVYEIPFIGKQATSMQMSLETKDIETLEEKMEDFYRQTEGQVHILRLISQSKSLELVQQNRLRYLETIKETRKTYQEIQEKLDSLGKDPNLAEIDSQIEKERQLRKELMTESERLVGEIATQRDTRHRLTESVDDAKLKISEHDEAHKQLILEQPEKSNVANTQYYNLKSNLKNDYDEIDKYLRTSTFKLQGDIIKLDTQIQNLMKNYNRDNNFSAMPEMQELNEYVQEANVIRNNNLVQYEEEATELRRSSEIGFKEEFVNKLRASVETAQQQIEELNMALNDKVFGADSYKLISRPSEDPNFKQYYNIIMGIDSLAGQALFTESLTQRNERVLRELFDRIASNKPEDDKISYQFLDYRNYMSYDIEVLNKNGNKSLFSKVAKEKSGGETQVPFYIVIAASFQQLLTRNKKIDAGCIVLFDEAFNNMDESRIDAMMKFYNSLSIQLLIAVPPQRVSNIVPYVTTSLAIVKENDLAIIEAFDDRRDVM